MKKNYKDIRYLEFQKNGLWSISSLLPNILPIDITLRCWLRLYRRRKLRIINVILYSKKKKKKKEFPLFEKGVGLTCEMPWLHHICVLKMWKLCTQQHCPMWKANVYLFRREKNHKCMKCSLHMYPTSPPPCPQERNYLFICLLVWRQQNKLEGKKARL